MAQSFEIPEWLKSELPEEELEKLNQLAGEHRVKSLAPLAKSLVDVIHAVQAEVREGGKSERGAELTSAFNEFRSAAGLTVSRPAGAARPAGAGSSRTPDKRKRDVEIWQRMNSAVKEAGYASITAAKNGGYDTKALRERVVAEVDGGSDADEAPVAAAS